MAVKKKYGNVLGRGLDNIGSGKGRGLDALIDTSEVHAQGSSNLSEIALSMISPNPNQPRTDFDETALQELAASIREIGLITVNALTAANSVIIPVQCEYFALEGISKLLNTIKIIKNKLNPQLEIEGFLLTMYDSRLRLANQIYDEVKRHFQELVFKTVIQRNVKLSESPSHGLPVILYDADSTGAKNHLALAKEIIFKNK